jgi:tetratricopeptide (TPR) repeat protein
MKKFIGFFIFIILFVSACTNSGRVAPTFSEVEILLDTKPDSALILIDLAIQHPDRKKDKELLAEAWLYKGRIWNKLREPDEAIGSYHKALDILGKENHTKIMSKIYDDMGNIYKEQDLYEKALEMFWKEYSLDLETSNNRGLALSLRNIGNTYFYIQKPDSAFQYLQQASAFARQSEDSIQLLDLIYNDISIYYDEIGEYEESFRYLQKVTDTREHIQLRKGSLFLSLQQPDSAFYYLVRSAETANIYTKTAAYYYLGELENQRENFKSAYHYCMKYIEQLDSIENLSKTIDLQIINHKYNIQTYKNEHRKKYTVLLLSSVIFILIVIIIFSLLDKKKKIIQKRQENELLKKENEIFHLQNQIEKTKKRLFELQEEKDSGMKLTQEKELEKLQLKVDNSQCEIFKMKPIYKLILQFSRNKTENNMEVLRAKDRQLLENEIKSAFSNFLQNLQSTCPSLTNEEMMYCCLTKLNLQTKVISACFGYTDTNPVRQKKGRIKKKMFEQEAGGKLFLSIFGDKKE